MTGFGLVGVASVGGPAAIGWIDAIGRSLREAFFMFWETLWPLVLGFGLSGAVQAFVSRESLRAKLGNHRPPAVARATGYGMASSSCSYAASAMGKSLFGRGADFVTTTVFMFASTNLVIELGLVLVVLIGWQFAVGEFVGGAIMVVLLATLGGWWFHRRSIEEARRHVAAGADGHRHGSADEERRQRAPWSEKLRSKAGWADAAGYTMADLSMVRRELLIGYTVAGFLAVLVPIGAWHAVFLHGHGLWTTIENALVAPLVAVISFVCSIGNVPLAAALWKGGISFGGVISFLFADLITFPLLLVYRRYYGARMATRMLIGFWAVMSAAGLATEAIFRAAGIVPTIRPVQVAPVRFTWNYTTYLNVIAVCLFVALYLAYRNRDRWGSDTDTARDPSCGMQVEKAAAPEVARRDGVVFYFCSDRCRQKFEAGAADIDPRGAVINATRRRSPR